MNKLRWLSTVLFLLAVFVLFGCGGNDSNSTENKIYPEGEEIEGLIWDTHGGGDIRFSIEKVDTDYKITVERNEFQPVDETITLTDKDLDVYSLVDNIFEQIINVYDYTFTPQGATGTWTTITLIFSGNREVEIENIEAWGELSIIPDFVDQNI